MDYHLKGKNVLVTGGAQGLGSAICQAFAAEGANVAVNYRTNAQKAQDLAQKLRTSYGVDALAIAGDVAREEDVAALFRAASDALGTLDVLVNNAAVCPITLVMEMSYAEWKQVMDVNLGGVFLASREMVKNLVAANKPGAIVNIASQAAYNGSKRGKSHYAASKGGVVSFTTSLAKEVARYGIRVNGAAPGMMFTEMTAGVLADELERYNASIPIGRVAQVEEVAHAVVFLASDASSYITGATIDVSGGVTGR